MIDLLDELYLLKRFGRDRTSKDPASIYPEITDFTEKNADGKNLLHIAVENIDLPAIQFLLEKEVPIEPDSDGNTLLHTLAKSSYMSDPKLILANEQDIYTIAKLLLDNKVKPKRKNDYEKTAYEIAVDNLAYPILKAIAEAGLKMDAPMPNGMNLMHYILERSGYNKITEPQEKCLENTIAALIESGLDPEDKDAWEKTPDYYAHRADALGVVAILAGQDRTAAPELLLSLKDALDKKQFGIADKILENGADINEVDEERKMTPLMWFCFIVDYKAVKYLISKGADVDYKEGTTGETAMSLFLSKGYSHIRGIPMEDYIAIYKELCNASKNIDAIIDDKGNTALNLLCKQQNIDSKNTKMVEMLIDKGANLDTPDLEGLTPMMSFARYNGKELKLNIIETLVDEGANVTYKDRSGNTVLSYATINRNDSDARKIAEIVLDKDASIAGFANINEKTPLDLAVESRNEACAKAILMNM